MYIGDKSQWSSLESLILRCAFRAFVPLCPWLERSFATAVLQKQTHITPSDVYGFVMDKNITSMRCTSKDLLSEC